MSSEAGRPSESRNRRPLRLATAVAILLVLLGSQGCGLKGDPLPPIRPPEPAAEEVAAETEGADEESQGSESAAADGEEDGEAEEDGEGQAEEDGEGAQGPA